MALPPLSPRLVLAGCTGLLLLGGIAGAATVSGPEKTSTTPEVVASDDTVAPVPGDLPAGGQPATVPAGAEPGPAPTTTGAPATTTAPAGGTARTTTTAGRRGASGAPGPLVAPRPGAYVYESTTSGSTGSRTDQLTTRVEAAGTEGAATIQAVTIPLDLAGQRADARNTVAWSGSGGAVVRRSVISGAVLGQEQLDCVWQPAFAQYAPGLSVGKTWTFATRCAGKIQGFDVILEQRATRRVTGTASVPGPAGPVATWTIADDTTVLVTSPLGATSVRTVGTQQLAPSLGLPLRTESKVEATMGGGAPQQSTVTTRLVSLP